MQRIDENTYIDDSLVTCAEYQLFIDEMRDQGEYYQPDHWTSYQFPAGQAREPILGVRHSDAEAFCEWLTIRDAGYQRYRLPTDEETKKYLLWTKRRIGYWIIDPHDQFDTNFLSAGFWGDLFLKIGIQPRRLYYRPISMPRFNWISSSPLSLRGIDHARTFAQYSSINLSNLRKLEYDFALPFERDLSLDLELARVNAVGIACYLGREFNIEFNHEFNVEFNLNIPRDLDRDINQSRIRSLAFPLIHGLNRDANLNLAFEVYSDIFILQQRITGMFPAYEGIRLVREYMG